MSATYLEEPMVKKLLIAEDTPSLQHVYLKILRAYKPDLVIDVAKNGREVVEMVRQNIDYNAILMDIEMPVMDGIEAARQVRKLGFKGVILAHTTLYHDAARAAMLSGGMDGFLLKQLGTDRLICYLEKYELL